MMILEISYHTKFQKVAKDKEIRARIEDSKLSSFSDMTTIRTASCTVLIRRSETRCPSCSSHRISLNVMSSRVDKYDPAAIKKNTPNIHMTREQLSPKEKIERTSHLKNRNRFEAKIEMLIRKEGVLVNENIYKVLESVIKENVTSDFHKNSPKYSLWEKQKKISKLKKASSMKWHPVMIRWCLSVYLKSPGKICYLCDLIFMDHNI